MRACVAWMCKQGVHFFSNNFCRCFSISHLLHVGLRSLGRAQTHALTHALTHAHSSLSLSACVLTACRMNCDFSQLLPKLWHGKNISKCWMFFVLTNVTPAQQYLESKTHLWKICKNTKDKEIKVKIINRQKRKKWKTLGLIFFFWMKHFRCVLQLLQMW